MPRTYTPEQRKAASDRAKAHGFGKKKAAKTETTQPAPAQVKVHETKGTPPNLFSGFVRKFDVMGANGSTTDPIPGYRLYAFLDKDGGGRISQALISGWQFVTRDEVILNDAWNTDLNTDLGSKVRIYGEQGVDGKPVYHFLMKKPLDLCKIHDQEREEYHLMIEASLRAGTFNMTPGERRYTASNPPVGSPSGLPPITISHKMSR